MGLRQTLPSESENALYKLRAAVEVRPIAEQVAKHEAWLAECAEKGSWTPENPDGVRRYVSTANFEVIGECGHPLTVIAPGWQVENWRQRIAAGKRHRKRCNHCPKDAA